MQTTYDKFLRLRFRVMTTRPGRAVESIQRLTQSSGASRTVLVVDCYPGVRLDELEQRCCRLMPRGC
jgi:hypothetical protein